MKLNQKLLGLHPVDVNFRFVSGDTQAMFNKNKVTQSEDWYYHNTPISYFINNFGHRCKNVESINLDNYILFAGCSHTFGVGLELEKTYPYIVSNMLRCDYYNLAVPASGIDVLEYNILTWLATVPQKPKAIMIQWPDHSRFVGYTPTSKHFMEIGSWGTNSDLKMIVNSEDVGMFNARKALSHRLITNVAKSPLIKFNHGAQASYDTENFKMRQRDYARDLSHSGIKSNQIFAEELYQKIVEEVSCFKINT
jgi:hypothetical protein